MIFINKHGCSSNYMIFINKQTMLYYMLTYTSYINHLKVFIICSRSVALSLAMISPIERYSVVLNNLEHQYKAYCNSEQQAQLLYPIT